MTGEAPTYSDPLPDVTTALVCSLCNALVEDQAAHTAWHENLAKAVRFALVAHARQQGLVTRTW